jgi:uroporphyrinogen decarboxylase
MDGAILFADILLVLDAMGRNVRFLEGEGPKVDKATKASELTRVPMDKVLAHLAPVGETVERVKAALPAETTLIGFCGSPWTVAVYAIEGQGGGDKSDARQFGYQHPEELDGMLEALVEASAHYLAMQAKAGADALMLFDSWAEGVPEQAFERWITKPTTALVKRVRELGVTQPIIGFPRGAGGLAADYAAKTGVSCIGLGTSTALKQMDGLLPEGMPVQGCLDPIHLVAGGPAMDAEVHRIVDAFRGRPHIFNLGHGVTPDVPIAHVERVLSILRGGA